MANSRPAVIPFPTPAKLTADRKREHTAASRALLNDLILLYSRTLANRRQAHD